MLHTKYRTPRPCGLEEEDFSLFYYISLCKTDKPLGGAINGPWVTILANLVVYLLVILHMKFQHSRTYGFREEDFLRFPLF